METQSITTVTKFQLETAVHHLQTYVTQNTKYKDATRTLVADFSFIPATTAASSQLSTFPTTWVCGVPTVSESYRKFFSQSIFNL